MNQINVTLFGNPQVELNGETVHFPYKKAEGLFYYILINKNISREEAVNIFWTDQEETSAKKNLRDALYKIKKLFGEDVFLHTPKSVISINSERVFSDFDNLTENNIIEMYKGDFLANLVVKDAVEFESWQLSKRDDLKNMYLRKIKHHMRDAIIISDYTKIQKYSEILLTDDPYNEKTYREVMKIYALNGDYNKALELFSRLNKVLKDDLDVEPELSTVNIYKDILDLKNSQYIDNKNLNDFFGRYDESFKASENLGKFHADIGQSLIISGEAGVGKTAFLTKMSSMIDNYNHLTLTSNCYEAQKDFYLKPWHAIFAKLGEFISKNNIPLSTSENQIISYIFPEFNKSVEKTKFDTLERIDTTRYQIANDAIINILSKICQTKKIIFIFDDIQWMDDMSLHLINSVIQHFENKKIMIVLSYRNDYETKLSDFLVPLTSKGFMLPINLNRFTKSEVHDIVKRQFANSNLSSDEAFLDELYKETEGNALFLTELINSIKEAGIKSKIPKMSLKSTNIIKSRILGLSKEETSILNAISIFFDRATANDIIDLVKVDELEMYETIEALQRKYLLNEIIEDASIYYSFSHQKIRDYVYESQSLGKRVVFHLKIAKKLEEKYNKDNNSSHYSDLIYHFEKGNDIFSTLKYKIEYMKGFYNLYNETFPIMSYSNNNFSNNFSPDENKLISLYEQIKQFDKDEKHDLDLLKTEVCYLLGRYYISKGEYLLGIENIGISKTLAEKLNDSKYVLLNYRQLVYFSIQVNDLTNMKRYIDNMISIVGTQDKNEDVGTTLRLLGLYYIKIQDYDKAKDCVSSSLNIFKYLNKEDKKYSLSIAAGYNYLGQMYKSLENHEEALNFFMKSIEICNKEYITGGLGIFYSNAGQSLYMLGKKDEAYTFLKEAVQYFEKSKTVWGRDMAEAYLAMSEFERKNYEQGKFHLNMAKEINKKIENPTALALVELIDKNFSSI